MTDFAITCAGLTLFFIVLGWNAHLFRPRLHRNSRNASRPKLTVIVNGRVWRQQTKNVHPIYPN